MYSLIIEPNPNSEKLSPCYGEYKPKYPKATLRGAAMDQFTEAIGEDPEVDKEYVLSNVRVKICGRNHNEYTNDVELSLVSIESAETSDDQEDKKEPKESEDSEDSEESGGGVENEKGSAMDRSFSRSRKMFDGADSKTRGSR